MIIALSKDDKTDKSEMLLFWSSTYAEIFLITYSCSSFHSHIITHQKPVDEFLIFYATELYGWHVLFCFVSF